MLRYLRLPFRFDVPRLQAELRGLEARSWKAHYQTLHYEGAWSALALRSSSGEAEELLIAPQPGAEYRDTPLLAACPAMAEVLAAFRCPLRAVRLMKLEAGAVIKEHRDAELAFERGEARFHVPILTHPDVEFLLDGERVPLREGECWYLNFDLPHAVRNASPVDRVHLVIDATVDDWLRELMADPACGPRSEADPMDQFDEAVKREMAARFRAMGTPTALRLAEDLERRLP